MNAVADDAAADDVGIVVVVVDAADSEGDGGSLESRLHQIPVSVVGKWMKTSRLLYRLGLCPCEILSPWCRNFLFELTN